MLRFYLGFSIKNYDLSSQKPFQTNLEQYLVQNYFEVIFSTSSASKTFLLSI